MSIREDNLREEKYLCSENLQVYNELVYYLLESNVSTDELENIKADLLEVLISAQLRGEDAQHVFGDYKKYCDALLKECDIKPKHNIFVNNVKFVLITLMVIFTLHCVCNLITSLPIFVFSIGQFVIYLILFLNVLYFRHYLKQCFGKSNHIKILAIWVTSLVIGSIAYIYL